MKQNKSEQQRGVYFKCRLVLQVLCSAIVLGMLSMIVFASSDGLTITNGVLTGATWYASNCPTVDNNAFSNQNITYSNPNMFSTDIYIEYDEPAIDDIIYGQLAVTVTNAPTTLDYQDYWLSYDANGEETSVWFGDTFKSGYEYCRTIFLSAGDNYQFELDENGFYVGEIIINGETYSGKPYLTDNSPIGAAMAITMTYTLWNFETDSYSFTKIDEPGLVRVRAQLPENGSYLIFSQYDKDGKQLCTELVAADENGSIDEMVILDDKAELFKGFILNGSWSPLRGSLKLSN